MFIRFRWCASYNTSSSPHFSSSSANKRCFTTSSSHNITINTTSNNATNTTTAAAATTTKSPKDKKDNTSPQSLTYAVFGLGNVGTMYDGTRHNVGFACLDALAQEKGVVFKSAEKHHSLVAELSVQSKTVLLVKPTTFMNLSGKAVQSITRWYKIPPKNVLVIADDVELPLGRIQLKVGGGTTQRGIEHITKQGGMGGAAFLRLRFGISQPPAHVDRATFVLQRFKGVEGPVVKEAEKRVKECILLWVEKGEAMAMNEVNKRK